MMNCRAPMLRSIILWSIFVPKDTLSITCKSIDGDIFPGAFVPVPILAVDPHRRFNSGSAYKTSFCRRMKHDVSYTRAVSILQEGHRAGSQFYHQESCVGSPSENLYRTGPFTEKRNRGERRTALGGASTSLSETDVNSSNSIQPQVKRKKKKKALNRSSSKAIAKSPQKAQQKRKKKRKAPTAESPDANIKPKKKSKKKKKATRSKRKKSSSDEPVHFYRNHTDAITIIDSCKSVSEDASLVSKRTDINLSNTKIVKFKVRGNPVPLARHRTYRGFVFNPSAKKQKQFCDVVLDMLPLNQFHPQVISSDTKVTDDNVDLPAVSVNITKGTDNVIPIFMEEVISVQIISRMKRPQKHFIANRPGPGRLRQAPSDSVGNIDQPPHVASHLQVTRTDVDNLAKFVLDSLNGVLYTDDRQVASLTVSKVYDDEEPYTGSTDVIIKSMTMEDINDVLNVEL